MMGWEHGENASRMLQFVESCMADLLINSIKSLSNEFFCPHGKILLTLQVKFGREFLLCRDVSC